MKKIITLFSLLFLAITINAQIYPGIVSSQNQSIASPVIVPLTSSLIKNLVGYFDFNEANGTLNNKRSDNNGTAETGVTYRATSANYRLGTALQLNGSTGAVALPSVSDFQFRDADFTIGCWYYCTKSNSQQGIFGGEQGAVALDITNNNGYFLGNTWVAAYDFDGVTAVANQWNFIAVSFRNGVTTDNVFLYLNGDTTAITANFNPGVGATMKWIGMDAYGSAPDSPFEGFIDEVFIYKGRALRKAGLDSLYNNGVGLAYPFILPPAFMRTDDSTIVWLDYGAPSTITMSASDSTVSEWKNVIGSTVALTQATAANRPKWSPEGIRFDGVNDYLDDAFTTTETHTIYVVMAQHSYSTYAQFTGGFSNINSRFWQGETANELQYSGAGYGVTQPWKLNSFDLFTADWNGTTLTLSKNNGTANSEIPDNPTGATDGLTLGAAYDKGDFTNVTFKEYIMRKGVDSAAKRKEINTYLMNKYNIVP